MTNAMTPAMIGAHAIAHGDVLATLLELPSNEFDALLCDPPYGFSFMGKAWDYDVPSVEVWREALRVLKPGAPLLSFGGTRTFHRVAVGLEDAGFELRDVLMWLHGKGFPKSLDVSKAVWDSDEREQTRNGRPNTPQSDLSIEWSGYGTALKPAWEPVILARKPLEGTVANNVAKWGVGGLAIDACRIGDGGQAHWSSPRGGIWTTDPAARAPIQENAQGRWPANLILDEHAGEALDAQAGPKPSAPYRANVAEGAVLPLTARTAGGYTESGGPSRFFYCSKVSTREREVGCAALPAKTAGEMTERVDGQAGLENPRAGAGRTGGARNHHPTLKPISLTQWLATLIKPPSTGAQLLIPYSGAGSEMIGALKAGWPIVFGIEGEEEYVRIAHARIAEWCK